MSSSQENASDSSISDRMTKLLTAVVQSLVDHPDTVRVETEGDEEGTTLRLYVSPEDLGKVIGKQGRTARSLRTILSAIASKEHHRFALDVLEAE